MRISTRFTLIIAIAALVVFGGSAAYQYNAEQRDLRSAVRRELLLLGGSLQSGIENALRDQQTVDVRETLAALEHVDPGVDIYVFGPDGELRGASPGAATPEAIDPPTRALVIFEPEDGFGYARFVAPLFDAGRALGFLVVARPLDDARNDLRQSGLAIAASALFYLVMITLCVYVAGEAYINRPVRRLMHAMRRFRMRGADTMAPAGPTPRGRHELETLELEYHHLQHALVEAEKKLGAAVVERRDLHAALQRADKLATLGQLAAALAHEVGSPLQVIQGRLHALLGHAHDAARTRREVGIALEQAERITRMVERLLGMTRGPRVEVASVNVVDAVQAVVDLLDHQIERRGVVFELDTSPDLPTAKFDPDPIQQIVLNLLTNALTATPPGHRVTVRLEPAETSHDQSAALRIVVEDAGCGMTEEQIEHAFDAFFTTHAEEGGTGLGLAVVRAITERRGGTVRICSRLGSGTEVVVELPWSNDDPTNASNAA